MRSPARMGVALCLIVVAGLGAWLARRDRHRSPPPLQIPVASAVTRQGGMVLVPAQELATPIHRTTGTVAVDAFWIGEHEVTNGEFARFVEATGYRTSAEQRGFANVFRVERREVVKVNGADWRHPEGPDSHIVGAEAMPVVQVSWFDAVAYGRWSGTRLPTESEWQRAARGGRVDTPFPWGMELPAAPPFQANFWQGDFPIRNQPLDGYRWRAPVARFPPNALGLFDMIGNVREWCARDAARSADSRDEVVRGGSWSTASAEDLTVWARQLMAPEDSDNQTGFRSASDVTRP